MKSFLTGSQVYGTPKEDSDIDLVVRISEDDLCILRRLTGTESQKYTDMNCQTFRFGKLNLICTGSKDSMRVWKEGTEILSDRDISGEEITKDKAIEVFDKLREENGIKGL